MFFYVKKIWFKIKVCEIYLNMWNLKLLLNVVVICKIYIM